jgi:uncharacterized protein RhaS with RHS repeats
VPIDGFAGPRTLIASRVQFGGQSRNSDEPIIWYEGAALTDRRRLHSDERGSIIATSDAAGTATPYTYGPYGEPSTWSGPRFRYTGQIMLPEAQLYHDKARVYDPVLGSSEDAKAIS